MAEPLVTVLIPTHNRRALLELALKSVCAGAGGVAAGEILVLDNASTDATPIWLAGWASGEGTKLLPPGWTFQVISQTKNLGMVGNWRAGLKAARGRFVKILCDDDRLLPGALARETAVLARSPHVGLVASARRELGEEINNLKCFSSTDRELTSADALRAMLAEENFFGPPSCVTFRRALLADFDPYFRYATDWAAWISLCTRSTSYYLAAPGCEVSLHVGNITKQMVETDVDFFEVFELRYSVYRLLAANHLLRWTDSVDFYSLVAYRTLRRIARHALAQEFARVPVFLQEWVLQWKRLLKEGVRFAWR